MSPRNSTKKLVWKKKSKNVCNLENGFWKQSYGFLDKSLVCLQSSSCLLAMPSSNNNVLVLYRVFHETYVCNINIIVLFWSKVFTSHGRKNLCKIALILLIIYCWQASNTGFKSVLMSEAGSLKPYFAMLPLATKPNVIHELH